MTKQKKVAVFGGGLMGSGIACMSALAGHPTVIVDLSLKTAQKGVEKALEQGAFLLKQELTSQEAYETARGLLCAGTDQAEALMDCQLVIEAVVERVEVKRRLFRELEEHVPVDVPILSNTSGLRITDICSEMKHPERALTAHFWFPAYLVPLVEIVMHDKSDVRVAQEVKELLTGWGKAPVIVKRDQPGQLANRILQAMIRESVAIVESGLATAEDVDTAIKMGPGIRLPAWGILEHADAVGIDLVKPVQDSTLPDLARNTQASPLLLEMLERGELGVKAGKGFYDWKKRSFSELEAMRNQMIITALKVMRGQQGTS